MTEPLDVWANYDIVTQGLLESVISIRVCTPKRSMVYARSDELLNLLRCAWAGSQKYGALVVRGIHSSFRSLPILTL